MKLVVLTPEKEYFNGNVSSVKVPGTAGAFEVREGHAPLVSSLNKGRISVKSEDGKPLQFVITGGFIEVLNNEVSVLASSIVSE